MKPMTFEEWDRALSVDWHDTEPEERRVEFEKARIGMIPEDEAVRMPAESEWPEDANEIRVAYAHNFGGILYHRPLIRVIPRSKPAWSLNDFDKVFVLQKGFLCVGDISLDGVKNDGIYVRISGEIQQYPIHLVKPFNPAYIGKPWSEIPEGVE